MINVHYFASLRETLGMASETLEHHPASVGQLRSLMAQRHAGLWQQINGENRLLVAVNQEIAEDADPVSDGDEVAFFPPVTGG